MVGKMGESASGRNLMVLHSRLSRWIKGKSVKEFNPLKTRKPRSSPSEPAEGTQPSHHLVFSQMRPILDFRTMNLNYLQKLSKFMLLCVAKQRGM